jgi:glycosyltransferase involved in cell wall biosynthesis
LGWLPEGGYLLTAARLTAWKGVDYLIDAMAEIPDVRLVVAGEGPQLATLRAQSEARQVADRVSFLGKVPLERMPLLMRAADYLVLYSGYEGLSHTLLEALHAGTPVIASARGGNPEVVRDGENGILVPHPDRHALVNAIRRACADDTPRQLAARTAIGLERFDWAEMVSQTERALLACAGTALT